MSKRNSYKWTRRKKAVYVVKRAGSLSSLLIILSLTSHTQKRQKTYDKLCSFMLKAGGVYTKFLQGVLLAVPEVQDWVERNGVDFFENVPTEQLDAEKIVSEELGNKAERININLRVIASGTFAQVYYGVLDSFQPVIIKIQRQTILTSIKTDIWLLKFFARFAQPLITNIDVDISTISQDFSRITLAEVDYKREARMAELMRERLSLHHGEVIIPKTYVEISTAKIIVQDRLGGVSLAELLYRKTPLIKSETEILHHVMRLILSLPFTVGLVYADPHPGNIRIIGASHIALVDFGAIDDSQVDIDVYRKLLKAVVRAMDGKMTPVEALDVYFSTYAPRLYKALEITRQALDLPPIIPLFAQLSLGKEQSIEPQANISNNVFALSNINRLVNPNNRFALRSSLQNLSYARAIHTIIQTMLLFKLDSEMLSALRLSSDWMDQKSISEPPKSTITLTTTEAKEIVFDWLEKVLMRNPFMVSDLKQIYITLRKTSSESEPVPL